MRRCKTAAEERALIAKEAAAMRAEFRETVRRGTRRPRRRWVRRARKTLTCPCARQDVSALRPRAVAKLMFMHMLGYPTHFGQMECLKLLSSTSYAEKVRSVCGGMRRAR